MRHFLPPLNSKRYYLLLAAVALFLLGPLGAVVGAFMLFSLGFSVGGQVLAGILGSVVTYGYGSEGKHGANYMQTAAASVASMGSLAVLIQARVWLGLPPIPTFTLIAYMTAIGMFGIGVGMLYTPLVVDRMQLTYPSGFAVANILRALTDKALLRSSIGKLGSGTGLGFLMGIAGEKLSSFAPLGLSMSTIGAGMVVGARIAVPGLVLAVVGSELTPWLRTIGWLGKEDPFRKIGFVVALGMILGAAAVDIVLIGVKAVATLKERQAAKPSPDWQRTNTTRLILWVALWGLGVFVIGFKFLALPALPLAIALGLVFVFLIVNGISMGISDSNPVSAAFVIGVFLMASLGLKDVGAGLMCAAILLVACAVGVDMQQDRSTGWRLGTNRVIQFRYQVIGILAGAVLAVVLAKVFLAAYPVLQQNQFAGKVPGAEKWSSAFTFKLVGVLSDLAHPNPHFTKALTIGLGFGLATEVLRKLLKTWNGYKAFTTKSQIGFALGFTVDAFLLPSPYASSFGGFVPFMVAVWFAIGGILSSFAQTTEKDALRVKGVAIEEQAAGAEEMSTISLVGGGIIAGDSLAALVLGIIALLATVL
jgi:uncharacterized oligopeptide transporter (OPT) family protein